MIFVDTGFFLALAQPRDALHQQATELARSLAEPFLVTEHVSWETVNSLSKPIDRPKAHRLVHHVRSTAEYEIVPGRGAFAFRRPVGPGGSSGDGA
jgi:predicted nucleic acid-binding protein